MKKYSLVMITLLCLAVLSACGKESAPALKTEDQIRHDLEQSEHFWYLVAPAATDAYSITDLTIDSRITEPKVSDSVTVAVTAESEYAKYNGVFQVKYLYSESDGCIMRAAAATEAQSERPACPVRTATLRSRCATYLK